MPPVEPTSGGVRLTLHVQPRASRSELAGLHGDALKVRVAAPPIAGAANLELVRFLASLFGLRRSNLQVVAGTIGRRKTVIVTGISVSAARSQLGLSP